MVTKGIYTQGAGPPEGGQGYSYVDAGTPDGGQGYFYVDTGTPDRGQRYFYVDADTPDGGQKYFYADAGTPDGGQRYFYVDAGTPDGGQGYFYADAGTPDGGHGPFYVDASGGQGHISYRMQVFLRTSRWVSDQWDLAPFCDMVHSPMIAPLPDVEMSPKDVFEMPVFLRGASRSLPGSAHKSGHRVWQSLVSPPATGTPQGDLLCHCSV